MINLRIPGLKQILKDLQPFGNKLFIIISSILKTNKAKKGKKVKKVKQVSDKLINHSYSKKITFAGY